MKRKDKTNIVAEEKVTESPQIKTEATTQEDYFAKYYKAYKNDYISQYYNAYKDLKAKHAAEKAAEEK